MKKGRTGRLTVAVVTLLVCLAGFAEAARQIGTERGDRLIGTRGADRIKGLQGPDAIIGRTGSDRLVGGRGDDVLRGNGGKDHILGGVGWDRLIGGPGPDVLRGGPGRDEFNVSRSGYSAGGAGNDLIRARDQGPDLIDCGAGFDTVVVDRVEDGVFNCEQIREPS